jgi:hypothetical protein
MSARARLRLLEESLSPAEAVVHWLAEARVFGGFAEYAASSLEVPEGAAPLELIIARVEAAARRESSRGSQATMAAAIASAVEDALVRYELVLRLNAATLALGERLRPRLRTLVAALGYLADVQPGEAETLQPSTTPTLLDGRSTFLREQLDELVAIVAIEDKARAMLERHYFDGAGVLFADVALGWQALGSEVRHLSESERPAKAPGGSGPGRRRPPRPGVSPARAAQERASQIEADARLAALTALGEQTRATDLLRTQSGTASNRIGPGLAVRALERHSEPLRVCGRDERSESETSAAQRLDGLSAADQARQLRLLADELDGGPDQ